MTTPLHEEINQTENNHSIFEDKIKAYHPPILPCFYKENKIIVPTFTAKKNTSSQAKIPLSDTIKKEFPNLLSRNSSYYLDYQKVPLTLRHSKRIAVLFSGGPAPGGNNILAGLFKILSPQHTLIGVCNGPGGFLNEELITLTEKHIKSHANLGGFDCLGTDRTKLKLKMQLKQIESIIIKNKIDGIIIIGGDDSNTNATILSEYLIDKCTVIGVPKTVDGDLQHKNKLPISFGFDTATKIYSELVGNIMQDVKSVRKYWHFIKLMGRDTSHVTLEVALQTKPTIALITEEILEKKQSLNDIINTIVQTIKIRSEKSLDYGIVLVPEGLIAHIAKDMKEILSDQELQLLNQSDDHGHPPLSSIPTEVLLGECVKKHTPFKSQYHSFGYEGRCGAPTLFDSWYATHLGLIAGALVLGGHTGYMASLAQLDTNPSPIGIPFTALYGSGNVIKRTPVSLDSPAFTYFESRRQKWAGSDCFTSPGPRQFWGPFPMAVPFTVALNQKYNATKINFNTSLST